MSQFLETTADKFAFRVAADRRYTAQGIWVLDEAGTRRVRVGLGDYMQQHNGDVAFASLRPPGTKLAVGDPLAEIETMKATVELVAPVGGTIAEVNPALETTPEVINQAPYQEGWLVVIEATNLAADLSKLLDAKAYLAAMQAQIQEDLKNL